MSHPRPVLLLLPTCHIPSGCRTLPLASVVASSHSVLPLSIVGGGPGKESVPAGPITNGSDSDILVHGMGGPTILLLLSSLGFSPCT